MAARLLVSSDSRVTGARTTMRIRLAGELGSQTASPNGVATIS
jgi:hypothetical protein